MTKTKKLHINVWGKISEKRVDELQKMNVDKSSASILALPNGKLYMFNEIGYRIQPYNKLKVEVIEIAKNLSSEQRIRSFYSNKAMPVFQ